MWGTSNLFHLLQRTTVHRTIMDHDKSERRKALPLQSQTVTFYTLVKSCNPTVNIGIGLKIQSGLALSNNVNRTHISELGHVYVSHSLTLIIIFRDNILFGFSSFNRLLVAQRNGAGRPLSRLMPERHRVNTLVILWL